MLINDKDRLTNRLLTVYQMSGHLFELINWKYIYLSQIDMGRHMQLNY